MIVLDTNVVSELMKPGPAKKVLDWVDSKPATSLYITNITQAEILHGILLLPAGKRRKAIEQASHFEAQIAAISRAVGATVATGNVSDFTTAA